MQFDEVIKSRYSVRSYKQIPVEDEKIEAVLEAGRVAPTAKNSQPQVIYVAKSKEAMDKIRELTTCHFDAPIAFIVCGDQNKACILKSNGKNFMEIDCAIVQTHMMLKATDLGLGTCWVGRIMPEDVKKAFNLPENIVVYGFLVMGYPAEDCQPAPRHFESVTLDEMVKYL